MAIPQPSCTPGAQTACACVGGGLGAQVCGLDRVLGVCACPDGSAPVDAPTVDVAAVDLGTMDTPATDAPTADAPTADAGVADAVTDAGGPADLGPTDTGIDVPRCGTGDLDSDDDGLTDAEERAATTDPCAADSDGDGVSDLIEVAAQSNPRSAGSVPPAGDVYVALPYRAPGATARETRELTFATRIRAVDVFFLVDNSASMEAVIATLRTNLSTIVAGVQMAIPDVRVGVGSFDSMPFTPSGQAGSPGDYTLWVRQAMSPDVMASQRAFNGMRTIDADTGGRFFGGDNPEDQTEAIFEVIEGGGSRGHENDAAALRSVRNALDPAGNGWVPRVDPPRDCGSTADNPRYGWGCFAEGRVPIVVLASDAPWYDGCFADDAARYRSTQGHNCN
ncbi:MAG: VWA domain-containing protein, partial [Deltaproteobacteria bacterium]|nr:VWA domain-containing protein [Deltaproteobacteria bacterium]